MTHETSLLIENASDRDSTSPPKLCPRRFRSRLATTRKLGHLSHNRCAPFLRVYVASVLRGQRAVAIHIFYAVVPLSIDSFMELLPDNRTLSLCLTEII